MNPSFWLFFSLQILKVTFIMSASEEEERGNTESMGFFVSTYHVPNTFTILFSPVKYCFPII